MAAPIAYHVKREERSIKADKGDDTTNMDLEFDVTVTHGGGRKYNFAVSHFEGIDLDKTQTRHLGRIAATIEKQQLTRTFDELGPTSELDFTNYNPSGWAGMMVAKTLGRYEHGFLGIRFPEERLAIGDTWQIPNDLAKEYKHNFAVTSDGPDPLYKNFDVKQVGGEANFKLVKIGQQGGIQVAEISYSSSGTVTVSFESDIIEGGTTKEKVSESGTIVVDLATGWALTADITKRTERTWKDTTSIDQSTTAVRRAKGMRSTP